MAHVEIETDDDFSLEGGTSFSIYGNTPKETIHNTMVHLRNLQFDIIPTWARKSDGGVDERYASKWTWLRDEAIAQLGQLHHTETSISIGGNQTMDIQLMRNKPSLSFKLK